MLKLKWNDKQRLAVIRVISFSALGMSVDMRSTLSLIYYIGFADPDDLDKRLDEIANYFSTGLDALKDISKL